MEFREFSKEYLVHVYDTGPDGKLSLGTLFDYFQDIASDHAIRLGFGRDDLMKENNFWVLSRIYAEVEFMPAWEDRITLRTWPRGTDKLFAIRDYEASLDGRVFARGTSSWLIVDVTSKRVKRPDQTIARFNTATDARKALPRNAGKLEPSGIETWSCQPFNVKISDLDVNFHTNNTRYLKWATDCYDIDFVLNNVPVSAEINYLAESRFGEKIRIETASGSGEPYLNDHLIIRTDDEKELCRLRIIWKNNHS